MAYANGFSVISRCVGVKSADEEGGRRRRREGGGEEEGRGGNKGCYFHTCDPHTDTYCVWLPRQILIEVHGGHVKAHPFFLYLFSVGYVTAHLEPNIAFGDGDCVEYVFLLLDRSFCPAQVNKGRRLLEEWQARANAVGQQLP